MRLRGTAEGGGKSQTDFIYQVLCGKRNQREECRACFTPWEAVNLYIDGAITYEELAKTPSYSFQEQKNTLLT